MAKHDFGFKDHYMSNWNDPNNPNPYGPPVAAGEQFSPLSTTAAAAKIAGPAWGLMISAAIFLAILVVAISFDLYLLASGEAERMQEARGQGMPVVIIRTVFAVVLLLINTFVLYAASKMRMLESLGLARAAAIISVIPCIGPCYFLGIPFGVWALVVLSDKNVTQAFRS